MACELIPWQAYIAGAILEPVDFAALHDDVTCEEERKVLASRYHPTGGRRRLRKIGSFEPRTLDGRTLYFSETVDLLAIFGRPNVDLNISSPGVVDIRAYVPRKRRCLGRWAEDAVESAVAGTVLQTAMTITHQINLLSTQHEWGRRCADVAPMRAHREPYVWAKWDVRLD
ncbi:hypothetical protein HWV62_44033 [Athelia sp. TMB]|nr:hypothetical protein HWV62_44033 [Athelia sp. TMB]